MYCVCVCVCVCVKLQYCILYPTYKKCYPLLMFCVIAGAYDGRRPEGACSYSVLHLVIIVVALP